MGDPKRPKKKYKTPAHSWQRERIELEKPLIIDYGLKNKKEIWRMDSLLRRFKQQAKSLIARTGAQAKKEEKQLIDSLTKLDLIKANAKMDDILGLDIKNVLARRLQTQVFLKGFSRSVKQARQFITHGHIFVGDKKITIPSYLVNSGDENQIRFDEGSGLSSLEHPERVVLQKKEKKDEERPKRTKVTPVKSKARPKVESKAKPKAKSKAKPEKKPAEGEKTK